MDALHLWYRSLWTPNCTSQEPGRKIVAKDDARAMLRVVFPEGTPHVEGFTRYMEQQTQKTVNKDQWRGFLGFVQKVKEDCSDFDENAAWPVIIDDYVAHVRESGRQG